jgi:hypothetical protein
LKRFRDLILPAESYEWAKSSAVRDQILRIAIDDGVVLKGKIPNPTAPAFPTTTIRLNRRHPEVIAALGQAGAADSGFQPVSIRGEALSDTVLRERR